MAPFANLLATMHRSTEHIAVGMKLAISSVLLGAVIDEAVYLIIYFVYRRINVVYRLVSNLQ